MPRVRARPVARAWACRSPVISWKHMADASGWKAQWGRDRAFTSAYPLPLELHFAEFTCSSLRRNLYLLACLERGWLSPPQRYPALPKSHRALRSKPITPRGRAPLVLALCFPQDPQAVARCNLELTFPLQTDYLCRLAFGRGQFACRVFCAIGAFTLAFQA